jgi:CheY-like chemotaxis protein
LRGEGLILLIDDEYVMRVTGVTLLQEIGYNVITAKNGREGIEKYKENADEIDLVVLDLMMPVMSGRECFLEIMNYNPDARVVLSSGFSRKEDVLDMIEQGLADFVHKPFRVVEFSRTIAHALGCNQWPINRPQNLLVLQLSARRNLIFALPIRTEPLRRKTNSPHL